MKCTDRALTSLVSFPVLLALLLVFSPSSHGTGVTVITHGYQGDTAWVSGMADAVRTKLGPGSEVSKYRLVIDNGFGAGQLRISSFTSQAGHLPHLTETGEVLIEVDWTDVDGGVCGAGTVTPTYEIAPLIANALMHSQSYVTDATLTRPLAELPIHLIGHSRGGSMMSEVSKLLAQKGVWVNQQTTLDPHPLQNLACIDDDPTVVVHENVMFADNYYEEGFPGYFPWGRFVPSAFSRRLTNLDGGYLIGSYSKHANVHLWYHGTIDLSTPVNDGSGGNITSAERNSWWSPAEN